jgi:hypothetical protein
VREEEHREKDVAEKWEGGLVYVDGKGGIL